jgi:23S rRNA pseudouridine1911/1915/1917 synthase
MLIAKDERTLFLLNLLFSKREVGKHYKALVIGFPEPPMGEIETMIGRNARDRTKMAVVGHGKTAITQYRTEQIIGPFSLLDITLLTGRTHQIRVHLDHIGCPIVGDETYGHKKLVNKVPQMYRKRVENYIKKNMNRQALHSYRLTFTHPITKELIDIKTDLPSDIQSCLNWMSEQFTEED